MFARSYLFAPGHEAKMLRKSLLCQSDAVVWDLEDGVAEACKEKARETISEFLDRLDSWYPPVWVRINNFKSKYFDMDLRVLHPNLAGLILPKTESPNEIQFVEERLRTFEKDYRLIEGHVKLHATLETTRGVWNALAIASSSPRMQGISLGTEDLTLNIGTERLQKGEEIMYARGRIALAAAAAGIEAVDGVYSDLEDEEGLSMESQLSYQLGFHGKFAMHPRQLPIIHTAFRPSQTQIAFAKKIGEAFENAESNHPEVIQVDGKMIDMPIIQRARQLLMRANIEGGQVNV